MCSARQTWEVSVSFSMVISKMEWGVLPTSTSPCLALVFGTEVDVIPSRTWVHRVDVGVANAVRFLRQQGVL